MTITAKTEMRSEKARCDAANAQAETGNSVLPLLPADATPAMKQYFSVKASYPDALLFYRMGDFYEMFFDDAVDAAKILDIALTKRGKHAGDDIPMCGVPVHSHEAYLQKLIASGRRVAICEQLETPEQAKKRGGHKAIVRREVVRVVTPGTITEESLLSSDEPHFLAAIAYQGEAFSLAWLDVSTGAFYVEAVEPALIAATLSRIQPKELLIPDRLWEQETYRAAWQEWQERSRVQPASQFDVAKAEHTLKSYFGLQALDALGELSQTDYAACGALLEYVKLTQMASLPRLDLPGKLQHAACMQIDAATRRNLELVRTLEGARRGSLLSVIDHTLTASGGRLLGEWLMSPLTDPKAIAARHDAIAWLLEQPALFDAMREHLSRCPDSARALSRLCVERGGPRDMVLIATALAEARALRESLELRLQDVGMATRMPSLVRAWLNEMQDHTPLIDCLRKALLPEAPLSARDGNFVASGYRADLDHFRTLRDASRQVIAQMQRRLADETGISTLKIKFNNVLGYFIEITPSHESKVPVSFIHRQTLAGNLRYTTPELAETARAIAEAADKALQLELEVYGELVRLIVSHADSIMRTAKALAMCDVVAGLAELASRHRFVRPVVDDSRAFHISGGRHPVVERSLERSGQPFIHNDANLSEAERLWLLTGPTMAGKSTFLRQNALIAILAQMGSFVPADSAHIGVVDRLFSRVGAADDLARGRSTFMVEMVETATILNQSTPRSLVILDEIGRGTATYDGLSIAWAVVEHLHNDIGCRGLFATHYHELTQLASSLDALACYAMQVKEWKGEVVFLHQVARGSADRSYGIHVARIAGLPLAVIRRAEERLRELESTQPHIPHAPQGELTCFNAAPHPRPEEYSEIIEKLAQTQPDDLSPKEALELIYALHRRVSDRK